MLIKLTSPLGFGEKNKNIMKNLIYLLLFPLLLISCSKSLDDGFEDANPDIKEKLLSRVEVISDDQDLNGTNTFHYDSNNRLTSITNGEETQFFNYYESGEIKSITGTSEVLDFSEPFESSYGAYEYGDVLEYDDKGNPSVVELQKKNFRIGRVNKVVIAHISYDSNPSPYYYTIKAAGLIDLMDKVNLDFGATPVELIKAKKLIPFNNFSLIIIKNLDGTTDSEVHFNNTYDDDKYLILSNVSILSERDTETNIFRYYYK